MGYFGATSSCGSWLWNKVLGSLPRLGRAVEFQEHGKSDLGVWVRARCGDKRMAGRRGRGPTCGLAGGESDR